jgi:hypothetical protein
LRVSFLEYDVPVNLRGCALDPHNRSQMLYGAFQATPAIVSYPPVLLPRTIILFLGRVSTLWSRRNKIFRRIK